MDILSTFLTPIRFTDQSPTKQDGSLASCKAKVEALVANLLSNHAKWQVAQQRGTALCYAIEARKTKCYDEEDHSFYPEDLHKSCDKLAIITSIFVDLYASTREILRQIRALPLVTGITTDITLFRTWKLTEYVAFVEELSRRYRQELLVKQNVMRNIAHASERATLMAHTTAWEFPEHVDAHINFVFLLLAEEVKPK